MLEAQHGRVGSRARHRVEEEHVVVLGPHPGRVAQHRPQVVGRIPHRQELRRHAPVAPPGRPGRHAPGRTAARPPPTTSPACPPAPRPRRRPRHAEPPGTCDGADHGGSDLPTAGDLHHLVQPPGLHDRQHPLLGLRGHHLEGGHGGLPPGHRRHRHVHPGAALGRRLGGGTRDPRTAQVLHPQRQIAIEQLQARLDEALLLVGVPDLHAGALLGIRRIVGEAGRGQHRHTPDPVTAGAGTEQHREVAGTLRPAEHQALHRHHPQAEHVDQRVVRVGLVEDGLPADGRDADGVAVAGDPRDHPLGDPAGAGVVQRAEPQRIHHGDGTRTHREDVAEDPSDAGGCALVRLDGRGMVVALDADGSGDAVAHVDDTGTLSRADQHPRGRGGEPAQVDLRALVRAVLGPHHRVHRQLEVVRLTSEDVPDAIELLVRETEGTVHLLRRRRLIRRCVVHHVPDAIGRLDRRWTDRLPPPVAPSEAPGRAPEIAAWPPFVGVDGRRSTGCDHVQLADRATGR